MVVIWSTYARAFLSLNLPPSVDEPVRNAPNCGGYMVRASHRVNRAPLSLWNWSIWMCARTHRLFSIDLLTVCTHFLVLAACGHAFYSYVYVFHRSLRRPTSNALSSATPYSLASTPAIFSPQSIISQISSNNLASIPYSRSERYYMTSLLETSFGMIFSFCWNSIRFEYDNNNWCGCIFIFLHRHRPAYACADRTTGFSAVRRLVKTSIVYALPLSIYHLA